MEEYFVRPIFDRTGYNAVNTLVYAAIALFSLYAIWRFLKKRDFDFSGSEFLYGAAAFVLFGSTCRVLTDLWDAGFIASAAQGGGAAGAIYSALASSGIFAYGYLTVTPGIYIVTAVFFLVSIAIGMALKNGWFPAVSGTALFLPCLLLVLPFVQNLYFGLLVLALAGAGSAASYFLLSKITKSGLKLHEKLAIAGQALDGAATYVVIDIFSKETGRNYFEQHVLSAGIGSLTPLGFGLFFLLKLSLATLIAYFLRKEEMDWKDKALVLVVVGIMGFAPGIRDLLRMLCGT
ncbi:Uncharacterised protein [uncultured archaeon]|nr:Uncharacterised protein [uncultured archaeon]